VERASAIGVIGLGVVGGAVYEAMKKIGNHVIAHDLKLKTKITDVIDTDLVFICVPTPPNADGSCNTDIVEEVVEELSLLNYLGVIAIKSTMAIGTTEKLIKKYQNKNICFVPEFLRERCAQEDFLYNHDLCVIGTDEDDVFDIVSRCHKNIPKRIKKMSPTESETVKYFNNVYNAVLITFANSFHDVCKSLNVNYDKVKNCSVLRDHINDVYLESNDSLRGFSGPCLPKDIEEIASKANKLEHITFFDDVIKQNFRFKKTILGDMRNE
jgi:UDPglucose 6-dehydrogenase